jgi:transcriptional regulator with XRE-family HTH domain
MKTMDNLQEELLRVRQHVGISQSELAEKAFLSQNTISQYERGVRKLTTDTFLYLLAAMNVSFHYEFSDEKGEKITMKSKFIEVPKEPIDFRAIRSEEGFRLWALQNDPSNLTVDLNDEHFVVYKKGVEGALFWLYLGVFDRDKLLQICEEEKIFYEEL